MGLGAFWGRGHGGVICSYDFGHSELIIVFDMKGTD